MKINMTNFIPMLSSSPPPIDEIDSPENDEDEFGIFASAQDAYDCSFDSPVNSPKGSNSNGDCHQTQFSNNKDISYPQSKKSGNCANKADNQNIETTCSVDLLKNTCKQNGVLDEQHLENSHCKEELGIHENSVENDVHETILELSVTANCTSHSTLCTSSNDSSGDGNPCITNCEEVLQQNCFDSQCNDSEPSIVNSPEKSLTSDICDTSEMANILACSVSPVPEERESASSDSNADELVVNSDSLADGQVPDLNFIPFASHENSDNGGEDDFAEFRDADYGSGELQDKSVLDHEKKPSWNSDDDEFGNFKSGEAINDNVQQNVDNPLDNDGDDFADFTSHGFESAESCVQDESTEVEESSQFADFENAKLQPQIPASIPQDPGKGINKISTVVNVVFPISDENQSHILGETSYEVLDQNCRSRRLWERLHETDQMPTLSAQWTVSHSFQQLLQSVNVDYHSILRTSTVPFFASGLGLLEPTKGTAAATEVKTNDEDVQSFDDPIPPVHFDWGSSGLVNPLDSNQVISSLIDLTFLNSSTISATPSDSQKDFSFEVELLTSPPADPITMCPKAPILEQLLSSGVKSSFAGPKSISRPCGLNEETVKVLDQLPNLSFMRAQMLMFPISNDT